MRSLQTGIMIFFGIFILIAILSFSGFLPSPKGNQANELSGKVMLWGTENKDKMAEYIGKISLGLGNRISVEYQQKAENSFATDIIEALASGVGPDIIILPQDLIIRMQSKIAPYTPADYSERDFKNTFIENGEMFIQPIGILALPISIDPMVMYWNRDIFTNKGISVPPKYWDEFLTLAPILTEKNDANSIKVSALPFGEYQNVTNAKDILAMLFLQSGNPLITRVGGELQPAFSGLSNTGIPPVTDVLRFYTDFTDPVKKIFSWNRAMPESKKAFLAGDLAVYFGLASEFPDIRLKNPNLNFDVALVPQIRNFPRRMTFGRVSGLAVLNVSRQKPVAMFVAKYLVSPESTILYAKQTDKVSPLREVLAKTPTDSAQKVFFDSTVISRSWLDPNIEKSSMIFQTTIDDINSGKRTVQTASDVLQQQFTLIFSGKL